jgi:hypothetical protein
VSGRWPSQRDRPVPDPTACRRQYQQVTVASDSALTFASPSLMT